MTEERLAVALRAEPEPIDDATRARVLARMSPQLDAIAGAVGARVQWPRRAGLAAAMVAALGVAWWIGRTTAPRGANPGATPTAAADGDREQLRPYVVAGAHSPSEAAALLAGRFATLDVAEGQLVRASIDHRPELRVALIGPAHVSVVAADANRVELAVEGTALVDARGATPVTVRARGFSFMAQDAVFAVQAVDHSFVVFVEHGELQLGSTHLHDGDWLGRSDPALAAQLKEHERAIAPPGEHAGIVMLQAGENVTDPHGAVVGSAPAWARVDAGPLVLASGQQHATVTVREDAVTSAELRSPPEAVAPPSSVAPPRSVLQPSPAPHATPQSPASVTASAASAADLYRQAEVELRAGEPAAAEATWLQLLERFPHSSEAASALYDLANTVRARDPRLALGYLDRLAALAPPAPLDELASFLGCRLRVDTGDVAAARTCFASFRVRFPKSPHDAEVERWLAGQH
jgi:hypothetical protein